MKTKNPFDYSDDNKRYHTWNYYLKHHYHDKVFKVALNAAFSCPNRDGTCGLNGCTFCGALGAGEYAGNIHDDLAYQFEERKAMMKHKWPQGKAMAYFQAYTNTYADLPTLQATFEPFMQREDVLALCIATRADCLEQEKIDYLESLTEKKDIWLELGLQSIHDETAQRINRGHNYQTFLDAIKRLSNTHIKLCVHIINSLPYESKEMMIQTAKAIADLPVHAIKIHMLHIMEDTQMAQEYKRNPFPVLTKEQYIDVVISQLEVLPAHMIIQRLTGDGVKEKLITPEWTIKKTIVLNDIDKEMVRQNTWQGKYASK